MTKASRSARTGWLLLAFAVLTCGCSEFGLGPEASGADAANLRLHIPVTATSVVAISVEVTAPDLDSPLTYQLDVVDGVASGTITIPVGTDRTITLRAFDGAEIETHRGSATVDIASGSNPELVIVMEPLTGDQPIDATLAEVFLAGMEPEESIFLRDEAVQLTARVEDAEGNPVEVGVRWAVVQPSAAEVDPDGVLTLTNQELDEYRVKVVAALGTQALSTEITFMSETGLMARIEQQLTDAFMDWWWVTGHFNSGGPALSTASFQHSAWPANFGMVHYSQIPRLPTINDPNDALYPVDSRAFVDAYRAIAGVNATYEEMEHFLARDMFDPADEARIRAVGSYLQGISYGALALRFDGGPLLADLTDLWNATEFTDYTGLLEEALGLLDEAITLAGNNTFEVPASLMRTDAPFGSDILARAAHSYKARLRAGVARTPEQRAAVDWSAVLADAEAGVQSDFGYVMDNDEMWHAALLYTLVWQWGQMSYFVSGMADHSGQYQEWMSLPAGERHPNLPSGEFMINTPDLRFPQGFTRQEQLDDGFARAGELRYRIPGASSEGVHWPQAGAEVNQQWSQPDRGTWRWSYYRSAHHWEIAQYGPLTDLSVVEMDLLAAEAHYRLGDPATAASLVNVTRTAAGLDATDADGANTSCVPRLPDGSCGGLFEMIKWEKRLEASHTNAAYNMGTWYFEGRGWGDLMEGTPLQWPMPAHVAEFFGLPVLSYGGGLDYSAPVGTYGY